MLIMEMADGASIALDETGGGESLLLVHGASQTRTAWARMVPLLSPYFRVFSVDRRGRGEGRDAPAYSLAREAEDIARVAEALPAPVHLVAHSYGALCALEALLLTERLASAVLYEPPLPTPRYPAQSNEPLQALLEIGDAEGVLVTFMRDYVGLPPGVIEFHAAHPIGPCALD